MKNMLVMVLCLILFSCDTVATLFHGEKPEPPAVTFTVRFDANGAMGNPPMEQTVIAGTVINLPGSGGLTKEGYRFVGWSESAGETGVTYFLGDSITVTEDIVFYARWISNSTPQFTITFNPNGATSGAPPALPTLYDGMIIIMPGQGTFTNSGKTFGGWNTEPAGTGAHYNAGSLYTVTGSIILYAKWDVVAEGSFTVTFYSNGGSNVPTQYVLPGGTATRPSDPILSGFIFDNWYSDSGLNTVFNFSTPITRNITLYAKWVYPEGILILDVGEVVSYLETQTGGDSTDDPVSLSLQVNLGNMTNANSGWRRLIDAIEAADKYVELDLSACTMNGTEFNHGNTTGKGKIVEIILPDSATSIAGGAFPNSYFTALRSFSGVSLTSIGNNAFQVCTSLALNSLPTRITSIGDGAFFGCTSLALTSLPAGITSIGDKAFGGCSSLTAVTIPASVTSIGEMAFQGCWNLTAITVDANNPNYASEGGILYNKAKTALIQAPPNGISGNINIPANVTSIGDYAFQSCSSLTSVTIPAGVTSIGDYAFQGCESLTAVTIPAGVISIGAGTFLSCSSLTSVTIPASVTSIGNSAFFGTSITAVTIPAAVTSIGWWAFRCDSLTSVTFEGTIASGSFASDAFYDLGDLREKYFAGGIGTYTRPSGSTTWTKQ